jgi:hypothetical protein
MAKADTSTGQPKWTTETTRQVAHAILKLCQPSKEGAGEPIDWQQIIAWLEGQRDAAIRERDKSAKGVTNGGGGL